MITKHQFLALVLFAFAYGSVLLITQYGVAAAVEAWTATLVLTLAVDVGLTCIEWRHATRGRL